MADILDQTERSWDLDESLRQFGEDLRRQVRTSLPIIIKTHNLKEGTADGNVATKAAYLNSTGRVEWKDVPLIAQMPVFYPGGGGMSITFPIKQGDEGLAIFSHKSIDQWWQKGGVQDQNESRMHSLSDGFLFPGFRSQPRKLQNISENTWQLRTDDGRTNMDFIPAGGSNQKQGQFTFTAPDLPSSFNGK